MHNSRGKKSADDYRTPPEFFRLLDREFHFTLDPCADDVNRLCEKYYTEADNGLVKSWAGETVFANPPYGRKKDWILKAYSMSCLPDTTVVLLIPALPSKIWADIIIPHADELRFCYKRIDFLDRYGRAQDNNNLPSCVVVFRHKRKYGHIRTSVIRNDMAF